MLIQIIFFRIESVVIISDFTFKDALEICVV